MRRIVFVLASGVAFVLALGVTFLDLNGGLAQPVYPGKCPSGSTYETVYGTPVCKNTVDGTESDDRLYGSQSTRVTDQMYGYGGNDRLYGFTGRDGISGGDGSDLIVGGEGNDGLWGDAGRDRIYGDAGNDDIFAQD